MSHRVIGHCFNNLWKHKLLEGAPDPYTKYKQRNSWFDDLA